MVLLIDNYDSFVHNLARYVTQLGFSTRVIRNDHMSVEEIATLNPDKIVISPGPCDPDKAGVSLEVIAKLGESVPILGVCLGHQAIGQVYGGNIVRAKKPVHGKASMITHCEQDIFYGIPSPMRVGRYHSLIIARDTLPGSLQTLAESDEGEIMALRHKTHPVYGVQFHPESIITENGYGILNNFLKCEQ